MIRNVLPPNWIDAYDDFRFELKATVPRLKRRGHRVRTQERYLHLGCNEKILPGFLNTDALERKGVVGVDLRFPLPFDDQSFEGIYAHHVVEHLSYADTRQLFREVKRVLKRQGIFRVVVPDARKFIEAYAQNPCDMERIAALYPEHHRSSGWKTALEVVDTVFRDRKFNWHRSAWDLETLGLRLKEAGFSEVHVARCNQSLDLKMRGLDNEHWATFSLYVEAVA